MPRPLEQFCFEEGPRTVLIAAHPDDETIGAASRLERAVDVHLIYVTDGAPRDLFDAHRCGFETREEYQAARRRELAAALECAGIPESRSIHLSYIDQEASLNLPEVAARLTALLQEIRPTLVLTHPYEGGHPDHDACAFAVHSAIRRLSFPVVLGEFTSYHALDGQPMTFDFLPDPRCPEILLPLDERAVERKRHMLDCFATQREMLSQFPVDVERFREAPIYDFTEPPHAGGLHYERYDWGMTGARFRKLAAEALAC